MVHYIHHVPGRLRVKTPVLKGATATARRVEAVILREPGVLSAETNAITGSIVIRYELRTTSPRTLLRTLHEQGMISESALDEQAVTRTGVSQSGNPIADALVEKLIGAVIERSAVALIGALI